MTTWVALLRGINVGKAKRLAMADLRALVEDAGYTQARTLLNSGNVVFSGPATAPERIAAPLEKAIVARVGFHSHVIVLDAAAIDAVVSEHTLTQADNPSRLLVAFVQDADPAHGTRGDRVTRLAPGGDCRRHARRLHMVARRRPGQRGVRGGRPRAGHAGDHPQLGHRAEAPGPHGLQT